MPPGPPSAPPMDSMPPGPPSAPPMDSMPPGPPSAPPMDSMPPGPPSAPPMDLAPPSPPGPPSAPPAANLLSADLWLHPLPPAHLNPHPLPKSHRWMSLARSYIASGSTWAPPSPPAPPEPEYEEPVFDKVDTEAWDSNWDEGWGESTAVFTTSDSTHVPKRFRTMLSGVAIQKTPLNQLRMPTIYQPRLQ